MSAGAGSTGAFDTGTGAGTGAGGTVESDGALASGAIGSAVASGRAGETMGSGTIGGGVVGGFGGSAARDGTGAVDDKTQAAIQELHAVLRSNEFKSFCQFVCNNDSSVKYPVDMCASDASVPLVEALCARTSR